MSLRHPPSADPLGLFEKPASFVILRTTWRGCNTPPDQGLRATSTRRPLRPPEPHPAPTCEDRTASSTTSARALLACSSSGFLTRSCIGGLIDDTAEKRALGSRFLVAPPPRRVLPVLFARARSSTPRTRPSFRRTARGLAERVESRLGPRQSTWWDDGFGRERLLTADARSGDGLDKPRGT